LARAISQSAISHQLNTKQRTPNDREFMADESRDDGTPWWGWVVIIAAIAAFAGLIVKSLGTGG
jgi:hypothetical protein